MEGLDQEKRMSKKHVRLAGLWDGHRLERGDPSPDIYVLKDFGSFRTSSAFMSALTVAFDECMTSR